MILYIVTNAGKVVLATTSKEKADKTAEIERINEEMAGNILPRVEIIPFEVDEESPSIH